MRCTLTVSIRPPFRPSHSLCIPTRMTCNSSEFGQKSTKSWLRQVRLEAARFVSCGTPLVHARDHRRDLTFTTPSPFAYRVFISLAYHALYMRPPRGPNGTLNCPTRRERVHFNLYPRAQRELNARSIDVWNTIPVRRRKRTEGLRPRSVM